ncbi:hypothetical protein BU25DRAFT_403259 [Macroventuria anomochaeta]|uniref:Uncharacterized protein n=1 Tax=Macroventuria anomochaeta TaxID=301207 RepID=A0ACB6RJV0_9PLEO|nr:uncharacterized protein BU25DRAFT_403259 [Macroventuria anomochaeta]KAF2622185.1 hypothetical protein BU25DRAFT_403259 [Macroventuria anomochaeta]
MALSGGQCPSAAATSYLVHHVALPPKLPQADDFDAGHERCLLDTNLNALYALKPFVTSQHDSTVTHAIATIENLRRSQDPHGNVSEIQLRKLLEELASGQNKGSIPLEIKAQNAGVLISSDGDQVTFEFLELSPDNKSTMLNGRLVRSFPGHAASIPISKLQEEGLQNMLADTVAKMSTQAAPGFQPVARKAGRDHDEDRDTTHPGMVTDYLFNIVAALGKTTAVTRITKYTREEVLWDNCKMPWRRSPMWLLVRVTLQLLLTRRGPKSSIPDSLYKVFMVHLQSLILAHVQVYWNLFGSDYIYVLNAKMLRRLRKLEALSQLDCVLPSWMDYIRTCMVDAFGFMDKKWMAEAQNTRANLQAANLKSLRPEDALDMHLPELDTFLASVHGRKATAACSDFKPGLSYPTFAKSNLPEGFSKADEYRNFRLAAVESWVQDFLQSWSESHRSDQTTCGQLYNLMKNYHSSASVAYQGLPSSMSVMYLTILEIWVACDKSACSLFALLSTYDPEVRLVELQCLTLPLRSQMQRLRAVELYWPLSPYQPIAKATVFELKIPGSFSAWRDASTFVIISVLGCKSSNAEKPQHSYILSGHRDLSHMLDSQYHLRRIVPLSSIKPHSVTHRNSKKVVPHLKEDDVCLQNGLRYQYFDTTTGAWTAAQTPSGDLPQKCMYQMPARSKALEHYLHKPPSAPDGVQPNEVIASLSDCPPHLSIEEYKAFGALPLGRNIFYSNILMQLAIPTLDFSKVETQCLMSQTVTQVGLPNGDVERTSHRILTDSTFGSTLIAHLEIAAQRVEENWESWRAMATFVQLACRVTNLTKSTEVRQRCLQFLHKARRISITWLHRLKARAASSTNDEQRTELFSRATEIALLGTTTFDVEDEFVNVVLQQQDAVSSLLQCSIAVQENKDLISGTEGLQNSALQTWRSLMYRVFSKLRKVILCDCTGLNQAVLECWTAFQPATNATWRILDDPHHHWLHIASGKLPVHINLLTGELLVNGLPLTRLPSEFLAHPMYKLLFSASTLEVVPTDEPGMRFSAKTTYHDHELHFGMAAADMLVVAIGKDKNGDHQLQSRQYRGMILDNDQRIGTLIGLTSKLVLRRAQSANDRLVLIPEGAVRYHKTLSHHSSVTIGRQERSTVHAYQLDPTLGRVLDNGAMQSKLMLCYLHALTSHWLPDPLTRYTGTEAALTILRSSAVRSFDALSLENAMLLNKLATLSPQRKFYPSHERVMQRIEWDPNLSFQSQHGDFQVLVREIFDHEKKMSLFHSKNIFEALSRSDTAWISAINSDLHERASIRSSTFQVAGFGAEYFKTNVDRAYDARDRQANSERGRRAFLAVSMFVRDQALLDESISNLRVYQNHFYNTEVKGFVSAHDPPVLRYDSKWLGPPSPLMQELWCTLHHSLATKSTISNKFDVLIWLSTMAYATKADMNVIRALVAFYRMPQLASTQIPTKPLFRLSHGSTFNIFEVQHAAERAARSYESSSEAQLCKQGSESDDQHLRRIESLFENQKGEAVQTFVAALQTQWPREHPNTPFSSHMNKYLDTAPAMDTIRALFQSWYDNRAFEQYIRTISSVIERLPAASIATPRFDVPAPSKKTELGPDGRYCHPATIFTSRPPNIACGSSNTDDSSLLIAPQEPKLTAVPKSLVSTETEVKDRLDDFCQTLSACAKTTCEQNYVDSLRTRLLRQYLSACEEYFTTFGRRLEGVLEIGSTHSSGIASSIKLSPRLSPSFWLSQLNHDHYNSLSAEWRAVMVEFGLAITNLHRAQRLVALLDKPVELNEELQHVSHTNWNPSKFPETLLLEAESGILVRKVQATIAAEMMEPLDAQNTVMQLNMGEGKSSTIVPIVAAALADRKKLVRVVVAKPQSKQMLQMLVAKLGGLLNRRIYHMPFSRDLQLKEADVRAIREMYQDCMAHRGVLLIQPEHILSFKLMGIECLLTDKPGVARLLLDTGRWFDDVSRDIVDESDENFSVKFELIYTMGSQRSIGFAPDRWILIQEVMGLIPRLAAQVKAMLPLSIEVQHEANGRYPRVRILRDDGAKALLALLTEHIIKNGLTGLPICNQREGTREAIMQYISTADLIAKQIHAVEQSRFWTVATKEPLLLMRGLIAGGVLRFSLTQKRWRVNYGLDPTRIPSTQLAVPYKAKDSPSPRSEFSHPDVVILLTLLSYYYGGLQDDDLFDSFVHLLKSDQATIHYDEWVRTAAPELPAAFRQLSGVSIKDRVMCIQQIFPHLRYSRAAINYYLTFIVFPKAMKEFPSKLSASGWDLGAVKKHPTTGFSGTNDTLHVLPLAVKHLDLPSQSHTNALVLGYLLQRETSVEKLPARSAGTDAEHLLIFINNLKPEVRVVLDVGAQILEMNNTQVAQCWLSMRKDDRTEAVVFFKDEELSVLDVSGRIESFQTSPLAKQLDRCLIYLDEAHTRGTDLKLPRNNRAAVTLGANLTKDRLVQACMRLRKLGKGQSVVFMATQEICTKIYERTKQDPDKPITVINVLCWSIGETWLDLSRSMPLWAVQGHRYETHKHLLNGASTTLSQAQAFLEDEAQSIEDRYAPVTKSTGQSILRDLTNPSIKQIHSRCVEFQAVDFNSAMLHEEQERELSPEIEEERQIERPPKMIAEKHRLHPDLAHLARSGEFPSASSAFEPAFQALKSTSAAEHYDLTQFPKHLLVTKDFMRTVKIPAVSSFVSDSYQRPVQWILSVVDQAHSNVFKHLIVLSPFEANQLLSTIAKHKKVTLHLYAPRFNASFAPLDKLKLLNIGRNFDEGRVPQSLTVQLNLFAGSLYLRSFAEYEAVCDFLGLLRGTAGPDQQVFADGFIDPPSGEWGLKTSPVQFLRALLMKIRKEGEGVEKTHMGRLLGGIRLEECDFETEVPQNQGKT